MTLRGQSIVLIGFMGVGKSATGVALAEKTQLPRVETDEMVARQFELSISEIFVSFGEEKFRDAETEIVRQFSPESAAIIVTGGGIILRPENVPLLRSLGTIVNLEADEETLVSRISRGPSRPLLQSENLRESVSKLLEIRRPLYRGAADLRLDTSLLTNEEVADTILHRIRTSDF